VALVQHHLKDGAAAGGEQLAGQEQPGHPALAGAAGHPPLGPVVAAQPITLGDPFLVAAAPVTMTTTSSRYVSPAGAGHRVRRGLTGG
jgi:hypothetical protein